MEVPQKSGAGGEDDPHQQVYENEFVYKAGGDDAGDSDAPEDSPIYNKDLREPIETCRCQGLEGEHGCEAAATRDGLCEAWVWGSGHKGWFMRSVHTGVSVGCER